MTIVEGGILILYDLADALYGPRKRQMTNEQKIAEFWRLLRRMSARQRNVSLSAATACGIEDFESLAATKK